MSGPLPALRPVCAGGTARLVRGPPWRAVVSTLWEGRRAKGDYGFNVFHNSNPQHGASYARHERRMRDDEVEDFMKSVKGWLLVREVAAQERARELAEMDALARRRRRQAGGRDASCGHAAAEPQPLPASTAEGPSTASETMPKANRGEEAQEDANTPPKASPLKLGEEAIQRTFHFHTFAEAYLFMGRLWAFCYGADKYPPVTWHGCDITVYLYSPSFHGLSKREARVAAFLNDQYNMLKKSRWQQAKIMDGVAKTATVEEVIGAEVQRRLAEREAARRAPLPEATPRGPADWEALIAQPTKRGE